MTIKSFIHPLQLKGTQARGTTAIHPPISTPDLPAQAATKSSLILRDNKYRLPRKFVNYMVLHLLGNDALRLVHAMLHFTCRDNPNWSSSNYEPPEAGYLLRLSSLRNTIGPAKSNDCRSYLRGIAELRDSGLFDIIDVIHDGQVLYWKYSPNVLDWLFADEVYGLLDITAIGHFQRALPIMLYTEICLFRWMPRPKFQLSVEALCATLGPGVKSWGRLHAPFVKALQAIAAREDMHFIIGLDWQYRLSGIDTLSIRLLHADMTWAAAELCKFGPMARGALIVTAQEVKRLDRSDMTPGRMKMLLP